MNKVYTKDKCLTVNDTEEELLRGTMHQMEVISTSEIGFTIRGKVKEPLHGKMELNMLVVGKTARVMDMEHKPGLMGVNLLEPIKTTKDRAKVYIHLRMGKDMREVG